MKHKISRLSAFGFILLCALPLNAQVITCLLRCLPDARLKSYFCGAKVDSLASRVDNAGRAVFSIPGTGGYRGMTALVLSDW